MTASGHKKKSTSTSSIWGGRFSGGQDDLMMAVNASIDFDQRLYEQDITGSQAHAEMLAAQGIITLPMTQIASLKGLRLFGAKSVKGEFVFSHALEDIHMNIETRLKEIDWRTRRPASYRQVTK
jgi:argininosuccinate lyase